VLAQRLCLLGASALGHAVMVNLVENGSDMSTTNHNLLSLHLASHNGHLNLVKLLVEKGANPNVVNVSRDTLLHMIQ
jgi:ankyrin repeat protein